MTATTLTPSQLAQLDDLGIQVICPDEGYVECPGKELHTTPSLASDCKVYVNAIGSRKVLCLYCFHSSCIGIIAGVNKKLYRDATNGDHQSHHISAAGSGQIKRIPPNKPGMPIPHLLGTALTHYPWSYLDIVEDPVYRVREHPATHYAHLLSLFDDDDQIWVGRDVYDSGSPGHQWRFRTPDQWIAEFRRLGPYVCPNPFKLGSISRCDQAVRTQKFLVVESDELTRDETGAVFRALNEKVCRLRAVVDTAGKSLHGWFEYPPNYSRSQLEILLLSLKCDPSMLNPSQPCRLPGMLRNGKYQRLIYFDYPEYKLMHQPAPFIPCNSQLNLNI